MHPEDVQDGKVEITGRDILTNLPYARGATRSSTITTVRPGGGRQVGARPTSPAYIGAVMLRHGGRGHVAAGTCQVPHEQTEQALSDVLGAISERRAEVG